MKCAVCAHEEHHVLRSTPKDGAIRRVRECKRCGHRWATIEQAEELLEADRKTLAKARELAAALEAG